MVKRGLYYLDRMHVRMEVENALMRLHSNSIGKPVKTVQMGQLGGGTMALRKGSLYRIARNFRGTYISWIGL